MARTWIIAEAGINHNGSVDKAKQLIDAAKEIGADIVKFQTFKTKKVMTPFAPKAPYQETMTSAKESQLEMIQKCELSWKNQRELLTYCSKKKIPFLSTPFDLDSIEFLANDLKLSQLKLPSGEINNAPFLLKAAQTGVEIILSTGMSTLSEVETSLGILAFGYLGIKETPSLAACRRAYLNHKGQQMLKKNVRLLHCTSEYPTPFNEVNLRAMETLSLSFGLPVGLSDHTLGIETAIAAVARGAVIIEKHLTLDKNEQGPDHRASLEPQEFSHMIKAIRHIESALGCPQKRPTAGELKNISIVRKSIVASRQILAGERFTIENLTIKRPGSGISPLHYWQLLGNPANKTYQADELIDLNLADMINI